VPVLLGKKFFIYACFVLAACGGKAVAPEVDYDGATRDVMSAKNKIVQKPTLIRSGLSPLTPEAAKVYMNALFNELIPDLEKTNITYQMAGNDIILTVQSHLILEGDSNIKPDIKPYLDNFAKAFAKSDRGFIEFRGHTSSVGASSENKARSLVMARTVAEYFMDRGVAAQRVFVNGMGESMWIADNNTREGRLLNHRVEIRISPLI
jgi:outer membrane protein OmpA-like peptidoglycan-associated protein